MSMPIHYLGRTRGYPFCIARVYAKEGERVLIGTNDRIHDALDNIPLCHVVKTYYHQGKKSIAVDSSEFEYSLVQIDEQCISGTRHRPARYKYNFSVH